METYNDQSFFFLTEMNSFTSSSFTIQIYNYVYTSTGSPTQYFGF